MDQPQKKRVYSDAAKERKRVNTKKWYDSGKGKDLLKSRYDERRDLCITAHKGLSELIAKEADPETLAILKLALEAVFKYPGAQRIIQSAA